MPSIENHPTSVLPLIFAREADRFTKTTWMITGAGSIALTIFVPLTWVIGSVGAILRTLTLGLYAILYSLLWIPVWGLLLGTSWLWLQYWPLRPVLFIPGIVGALVGHLILMCAPREMDVDAVLVKVSMTEDWPLSWKLAKAYKRQYKRDEY